MHQQAQEILLALRQQGGLHDGSDGFSLLAGQYPWYPTAWLGACLEDPDNTEALQKAALHIHHPLRMQWLTYNQASLSVLPTEAAPLEAPVAIPEETLQATVPPEDAAEPMPPAPADTDAQEAASMPAPAGAPTTDAPVQASADASGDASLAPPAMMPDADDTASEEEALLFQPYYTVDYFASQGIKVEGMLQQTNRFDRQLMSFTQWLKTMKKLNYEGTDKASDPSVDARATASVVPKEVVTEAMAEVLLKQGKLDQAIALYAKLTLLHPEKSVFFATQIQKIKEQQ